MQLARLMGRLTAGGKMGDGQARATGEKLSWNDLCFACAGDSDTLPWNLALLKYQGDKQVYAEAKRQIVAWAHTVRWHEYAPVGKRWRVPDEILVAMTQAALQDYVADRVGVSVAQLARFSGLKVHAFTNWSWVFKVMASHLNECEYDLEQRIKKRLH